MKPFSWLCLGAVLLAACRPDDVIDCTPLPAGALATLTSAAPPVQTFTFDLGQAQRLGTLHGATVAFGAGVFRLPNGTVATGQAQLRLREIYEVPDMLLADLPTTTVGGLYNQRLLLSGGEFTLQVWQGTTRLRLDGAGAAGNTLSPRVILTSPMPLTNPDTARMQLWNQPLSAALRDSTGWQLVLNPGPPISTTPVPSAAGFYTAALPLDTITYWNIDRIWPAYQGRSAGLVPVEVPSAVAATGTRVYFRPVGLNGLFRGRLGYGSGTTWSAYLPYGVEVVAVVLQERAGTLYYGTQRFTTASGRVVTPVLEALPAAEIVRRIRLL